MKGTPEQPQCGFSMRVVGVLDSYGVEYAALDGLSRRSHPLRQVTAEIADWRTFPQLYVKGELVGGAGHRRGDGRVGRARRAPGSREAPGRAPSAKQELQQDPQQSPPIQIDHS